MNENIVVPEKTDHERYSVVINALRTRKDPRGAGKYYSPIRWDWTELVGIGIVLQNVADLPNYYGTQDMLYIVDPEHTQTELSDNNGKSPLRWSVTLEIDDVSIVKMFYAPDAAVAAEWASVLYDTMRKDGLRGSTDDFVDCDHCHMNLASHLVAYYTPVDFAWPSPYIKVCGQCRGMYYPFKAGSRTAVKYSGPPRSASHITDEI
jgi:hypothetical protein